MRELNLKEVKEVNGGMRIVKFLRYIALSTSGAGQDRYGADGWRP